MHAQSDSADLDFRDHVMGGDAIALNAARDARLRKAARALVKYIKDKKVGDRPLSIWGVVSPELQALIDAVKKELG